MRSEGDLVYGGKDRDLMGFGYATGPDQVWHDDPRGSVLDELAELPAAQEPF